MNIGNDERLFLLKNYASKHFRLTKNVRVLILLISEKETRTYRELATKYIEANPALQEFLKQR